MRVLLTGATGLLGRAVLDLLHSCGHDAFALCRPGTRPDSDTDRVVEADLGRDLPLSRLPSKIMAVVHCAAHVPEQSQDFQATSRLWRVNALGTLNLLTWARKTRVSRFIYCSSHSVYARPLPFPVNEDHPTYPASHATPYAVSKLAGEIFVSSMQTPDFRVFNLRFSTIYGRGNRRPGVVDRFAVRAQKSETLLITSHPESMLDLVYVDDAAQAIGLALHNDPRRTIYNIGAGFGVALGDLAEIAWDVFAPSPTARIDINDTARAAIREVLDISRARSELGYSPRYSSRTGMEAMKLELERGAT